MHKQQFEKYLISKGYKTTTPSGHPSTVYDYIKRIDKVCEWESCSWEQLIINISTIVKDYDIGGSKEELGNKSHNSVINALKRLHEYANNL